MDWSTAQRIRQIVEAWDNPPDIRFAVILNSKEPTLVVPVLLVLNWGKTAEIRLQGDLSTEEMYAILEIGVIELRKFSDEDSKIHAFTQFSDN